MTRVPVERRIITLLEEYLEGERTLDQFLPDFALLSWNAHRVGEPCAERLANEIELRLAEYSNGDWSREQLRGILWEFLTSHADATISEIRLTMSTRLMVRGAWTESAQADTARATVTW